jgi:hypothetical protein
VGCPIKNTGFSAKKYIHHPIPPSRTFPYHFQEEGSSRKYPRLVSIRKPPFPLRGRGIPEFPEEH